MHRNVRQNNAIVTYYTKLEYDNFFLKKKREKTNMTILLQLDPSRVKIHICKLGHGRRGSGRRGVKPGASININKVNGVFHSIPADQLIINLCTLHQKT